MTFRVRTYALDQPKGRRCVMERTGWTESEAAQAMAVVRQRLGIGKVLAVITPEKSPG